ncbi:MAG: hypothetical protein MUC50_22445 [Myxococcota bacterium]|nr:hypothetical protein [Myxococcota bacterium]
MTQRIAWMTLAALALGFVGCGDDSPPSCEKAFDHFYDAQCALTVGDYLIDEQDAVEGCEDTKESAKQEGCTKEFNAALECIADVEEGDCGDCDDDLSDMNECI